jgi:hypothetical protein
LIDNAEVHKHNGRFEGHTVALLQIDYTPFVRSVSDWENSIEVRPCFNAHHQMGNVRYNR